MTSVTGRTCSFSAGQPVRLKSEPTIRLRAVVRLCILGITATFNGWSSRSRRPRRLRAGDRTLPEVLNGHDSGQVIGMNCVCCGPGAVTEQPEVTAGGYRRYRCRTCGRQFDERSGGMLNRTCVTSDIIAFVVFCRLRCRLTLCDLSGIMALRAIEVSHESIQDWQAKLLPITGEALRKRQHGRRRSGETTWHVDETYLKVRGCWCATSTGRSIGTRTWSTPCWASSAT